MENKGILNRSEEDDIYLRSEEVQEIMGKVPPAILRWGISCIVCILLTMLVGSFFFEYPETISSEVVISSTILPVEISPKDNGRLVDVYVGNGCCIDEGDTLAALSTGEVIKAPISGIINYIKPCEINSMIKANDPLFSIRPDSIGQIFAKARVSKKDALRISVGLDAIIRPDFYSSEAPYAIRGKVAEVSSIPDSEGYCYIKIDLPQKKGVHTPFLLSSIYQMRGSTEIIINKKKLVERIIRLGQNMQLDSKKSMSQN